MEDKSRSSATLGPGPHTKVKRHADRAHYDAATVYAIIDEALYCTVSFAIDGQPFALPTAHARIDNAIYLHGAAANHMFRSIASAGRTCLSFTLIDGLVMARNAFNHSMNYRSVAVFGEGQEVTDLDQKRIALDAIVNHNAPGRSNECAPPTLDELKATLLVRVVIEEAAAKVRTGPVIDYPEHVAAEPCWAGVIPLQTIAGDPQRDAQLSLAKTLGPVITRAVTTRAGHAPIERVEDDVLFSTDKARLDVALIHRFLRDESYWAKGVELARVQKSIDAALCFGVYRLQNEKCQQIGFARVLSDGGRFGYLGDVFVITSERGHGMAKRLVEFVLDHQEVRDLDRLLLGTADAHGLYARYGFEQAPLNRYMIKLSDRVAPVD